MNREPVVAGQFYPGTKAKLEDMLKLLTKEKGELQDAIGCISPHAGYVYSGEVAGKTLSSIKIKKNIIILGPNHTGLGKPFSIMTEGKWKTPIGEVQIAETIAKKILEASDFLEEDPKAHEREHSIEVQIPFLQYLKKDFEIVPIVATFGSAEILKKIGLDIAKVVKEFKEETLIVASSDMTHYEPQEAAKNKDFKAIEAILKLDEDALLKTVEEFDISMCGIAPATIMLVAAKSLGAKQAKLIKYQTSGDASGDYNSVVGYAGITISR